jgi:hypothetical protein
MASGAYVTLIGDLIESRRAESRVALQRSLDRALYSVNEPLEPAQPFEPTVGDEFQAAFQDPLSAARASLVVRLTLLKETETDARFGLGWGEVTIFEDRTPVSQDGPGWWAARAAIERVGEISRDRRTDFVRTYLETRSLRFSSRGEIDALNAFFFCRDSLIAQMRPRARRLLLGLILERPQGAMAVEEGISQSAVSQSLAKSGAHAIGLAEQALTRNLSE